MAERIIEIEAKTLGEARRQVKSQTPEGFYLLSEQVISSGKPQMVKAAADTVESAFAKAQADMPNNVEVLNRKELVAPVRKTIMLKAPDEQDAESSAERSAQSEFGSTAIVKGVKLIVAGKKGFLGIGKELNQYEAEILQQAVVEVTYRMKAKISARIGIIQPAASSPMFGMFLAEFDAAQDVNAIFSFVRNNPETKVEQICAYYPLDSIRPGLERRDIQQLRRLERITTLAVLLVKYASVLDTRPELKLPPNLNHRRLTEILMPRLITCVDQLRGLSLTMLASSVSPCLYTTGVDLMELRPRDARIFIEVSQAMLCPPRDYNLHICGCCFNIAQTENDPVAIDEGIRIAKDIVAGKLKTVSSSARDSAQKMLEELEKLKAEVGV